MAWLRERVLAFATRNLISSPLDTHTPSFINPGGMSTEGVFLSPMR